MSETERLYYTDAYCVAFEANVVAREDDGRRVVLDRTAFYPTSGGQPHDLGTLDAAKVIDVIDEGTRIVHVVDAPLPLGPVSGTIDWVRRFDHMQQHTGQHLLSAVFADQLGYSTVSVHFAPDLSTLDLSTPTLSRDDLRRVERRANELVAANLDVVVSFEEAATATGLRKETDRSGPLRVVTIQGIDRSACGGTHVRATGEIGGILLRGQEKMKQNARIEFLCGHRAVRRARADFELLSGVARALNASLGDVPALVAAQGEQLKAAVAARRGLEEELAGRRARERHAATTPDANGLRWIIERHPTGGTELHRAFAIAFAALPKAVFAAVCDGPRAIVLSASPDSGVDAGAWLKARLIAVGGRGGGSPRLAQGSVPTGADLDAVAAAVEALRGPSGPPNRERLSP